MIRQVITLETRNDAEGFGHFGAPRGSRNHRGHDFTCYPGEPVLAPVRGSVTKLGYPYSGDMKYRYVQITDDAGNDHRIFYVAPTCTLGQAVMPGSEIGIAQDIAAKYGEEMTPHVHYEIRTAAGEFIDPLGFEA